MEEDNEKISYETYISNDKFFWGNPQIEIKEGTIIQQMHKFRIKNKSENLFDENDLEIIKQNIWEINRNNKLINSKELLCFNVPNKISISEYLNMINIYLSYISSIQVLKSATPNFYFVYLVFRNVEYANVFFNTFNYSKLNFIEKEFLMYSEIKKIRLDDEADSISQCNSNILNNNYNNTQDQNMFEDDLIKVGVGQKPRKKSRNLNNDYISDEEIYGILDSKNEKNFEDDIKEIQEICENFENPLENKNKEEKQIYQIKNFTVNLNEQNNYNNNIIIDENEKIANKITDIITAAKKYEGKKNASKRPKSKRYKNKMKIHKEEDETSPVKKLDKRRFSPQNSKSNKNIKTDKLININTNVFADEEELEEINTYFITKNNENNNINSIKNVKNENSLTNPINNILTSQSTINGSSKNNHNKLDESSAIKNMNNNNTGNNNNEYEQNSNKIVDFKLCPICLEHFDFIDVEAAEERLTLLNIRQTCCESSSCYSNINKTQNSGLITMLCGHNFHIECSLKFEDEKCPICRYFISPLSVSTCSLCTCEDDLWLCLICGSINCGNEARSNEHRKQHYQSTGHIYAKKLGDTGNITYDFSRNINLNTWFQQAIFRNINLSANNDSNLNNNTDKSNIKPSIYTLNTTLNNSNEKDKNSKNIKTALDNNGDVMNTSNAYNTNLNNNINQMNDNIVNEIAEISKNSKDKLDYIISSYNSIISSQLESQRFYYLDKIHKLEEIYAKKNNELDKDIEISEKNLIENKKDYENVEKEKILLFNKLKENENEIKTLENINSEVEKNYKIFLGKKNSLLKKHENSELYIKEEIQILDDNIDDLVNQIKDMKLHLNMQKNKKLNEISGGTVAMIDLKPPVNTGTGKKYHSKKK